MSELITQTAKLVPYAKRPKQASGFVTAYYYEPMASDPGFDRGNLYVVMEVLVSGRASEEVTDLIIDTIGEYYYNQPDSAHADTSSRFEGAIRAANHELSAHVNRGNAAWIGKLSAVVAIQVNDDLHVAQSGSGEAFLYRGQSHTHITTAAPNRPTSPTKTFGSIASGQLEAGDRVLLATPALIHQVPLSRLQDLMTESSPNAAIAEITDLLNGVTTERIAALIIEITTPELAAVRVRSEQPNEIHLGAPETAFDVARHAAAPLAQTTAASTQQLSRTLALWWPKLKSWLRSISLKLVQYIRNSISTQRNRRISLGAIGIIVVVTIGLIWHTATSTQTNHLLKRYQAAYSDYTQAKQLLMNNQRAAAQTSLNSAKSIISELRPDQSILNTQLAHSNDLQSEEPHNLVALNTIIDQLNDQISGLTNVTATTIARIGNSQSQLKHFEIYRDKAYIFDSSSHNQLTITNLNSNSKTISAAQTNTLDDVVDTTIAGNSTGIFILTSTPAVWFYNFATGSLIKQTVAGNWPPAQAIGSYGTNLYILSNGRIIKFTKTANGYSSGSPELDSHFGSDATNLAVDGSIYVSNKSRLNRYFGGQLNQSTTLPNGLTHLTHLRSTADTSLIIGTDQTTGHIGLWTASATSLNFRAQLALNHLNTVYAATYDSGSGLIYATVPGQLVSFPFQP